MQSPRFRIFGSGTSRTSIFCLPIQQVAFIGRSPEAWAARAHAGLISRVGFLALVHRSLRCGARVILFPSVAMGSVAARAAALRARSRRVRAALHGGIRNDDLTD